MGAFHRFDVDESGFVTLDNLRTVLGDKFEGESVEQLLGEADTSGDGQISYEDFLEYLQAHDTAEGEEDEFEILIRPRDEREDAIPDDADTHVLLPPGGTHGSPSARKQRHAEMAASLV